MAALAAEMPVLSAKLFDLLEGEVGNLRNTDRYAFFFYWKCEGPTKSLQKSAYLWFLEGFMCRKNRFCRVLCFFFDFWGICFIPNFCIYFHLCKTLQMWLFFERLPIFQLLERLWECHDPPSSQASYLLKFQEWMANFSAADLQRRTGIQHSTETVNASLLQTHSITQNIMKLFGKKWEGRKPTGFGIFLVLKNWDVRKDLGIWRFQ